MNKLDAWITALMAALLLPLSVSADINPQPALFANAEQFELHSKEIGEDFLIQVGLPASYATGDKRYPVLYVLDGNISFGSSNEMVRLMSVDLIEPGFPELIVVSIGYVKAHLFGPLRTRDLTPKGSVPESFFGASGQDDSAVPRAADHPAWVTAQPAPDQLTSGGADAFLAFIEKQLDPVIRKQYRTDGGQAGILGDSFGGLFTYYAFLKQSPLFDKYWLGSPGLIQEDTQLLEELPALLQNTDFKGQRVYISVGEKELSHSFYGVLGRNYAKMVGIFEANPGKNLAVESRVFVGDTHITVVPAAMVQALRFLYTGS